VGPFTLRQQQTWISPAADTMTRAAIDPAAQREWRLEISVLNARSNVAHITRMDGRNLPGQRKFVPAASCASWWAAEVSIGGGRNQSGEKLVQSVWVYRSHPTFSRAAVAHVEHLAIVAIAKRPSAPLPADCPQNYNVLVIGQKVMHLHSEGTVGQLKEFLEEAQHCVYAVVITGGLISAPLMPLNVSGEHLATQRVHVPSSERVIPTPNRVSVTARSHAWSLPSLELNAANDTPEIACLAYRATGVWKYSAAAQWVVWHRSHVGRHRRLACSVGAAKAVAQKMDIRV
jgi:hypothetical protein